MIRIKVENEIDRFINKCINNNIYLNNIKKDNNTLFVDIKKEDYKLIKRINYYSNIKIIKQYGKNNIKKHIKKYLFDYINLLLFLILIFISSNIIIKVEINHENKSIIKYVNNIIREYGIKVLTIKKDLNTLNKISDEIIYKNRDKLEWISINNVGMKYIISVEERILEKEIKEDKYCNIISTKDAIITKIINHQGVNLVEKNSHVIKDETLISGEIKLNEDIKDNTCAKGEVYGETWYKIHITKPLIYETKEYTEETSYNIKINNKYLRKIKYKKYDEEIIYKIKNIKLVKLKEYKIKTNSYTYKEAKDIAMKEAIEKLKKENPKYSIILSQKVLKETQNNSKIELDIFVSVEQIISKRITYEVGEINGDDTG